MPSQRQQTIISPKGLVTIPEPYRSYHKIGEGDAVTVMWDNVVVIIPAKIKNRIPSFTMDLINIVLSKMGPVNGIVTMWSKLTDQQKEMIASNLGLVKRE